MSTTSNHRRRFADRTPTIGTVRTLAFVRRHVPRRACRVLEVGCGDGDLAAALQSSRCEVLAIDTCAAAVRRSRRLGVDARCADWHRFRAGSFDVVVFAQSLHACGRVRSSVGKAVAQLREGGRLLVEDFDPSAITPATVAWLRGVASGLAAAGGLGVRHWLIRCVLGRGAVLGVGRRPRSRDRGDDLRTVLSGAGRLLEEESTEHLYRYFEGAGPLVQERVRRAEAASIAAGAIASLGRRFVVGR